MANVVLEKPKKSRRETTEEWLDHCALEGIYPDQETLDEFALVDASDISPEEYLAYLNKQYPRQG